MEYVRIKDINFKENIGKRVYGIFLAKDVSVRQAKDGKEYIDLNMSDIGVCINAKRFAATPSEIEMMCNGGVYMAAIDIKEYTKSKDGFSCILYNFDKFEKPGFEPQAFIEWTEGVQEANKVIQDTINLLTIDRFKTLVYNLLISNWNQFASWSAASSIHHMHLGGLIVHTAEVIKTSEQIAEYYTERYGKQFIDNELMLAGAILHDIGKIKELDTTVETGLTQYSNLGGLEGHITLGISMIDAEAINIGFGYQKVDIGENLKSSEQIEKETEDLNLLKHIILSHHGLKEWGSPVEPATPEASIVSAADKISAEMFRYNDTFKKLLPGDMETLWINGKMLSVYKSKDKK